MIDSLGPALAKKSPKKPIIFHRIDDEEIMTAEKRINNYEPLINALFKKHRLSPTGERYAHLISTGADASRVLRLKDAMTRYFTQEVQRIADDVKADEEALRDKKKLQERAIEVASERTLAPVRLNNSRTLMSLPWFSPDQRLRKECYVYSSPDNSIQLEVHPSPVCGAAKVWDADVLMYALSKAVRAYFETGEMPRTVTFSAYEYLKQAGKDPGSGKNLSDIKHRLERLSLTRYKYIRVNPSNRFESGGCIFGLCTTSWTNDSSGRLDRICITFAEELFEHFASKNDILTLNKDLLLEAWKEDRSGLRKRLLMLVGVHLGNQPSWKVGLKNLRGMCGYDRELKYFKRDFQNLIDSLPWPIDIQKNQKMEYIITFFNTDSESKS